MTSRSPIVAMSFRPSIPWRVALQQSPPPLARPGSCCTEHQSFVEHNSANGNLGLWPVSHPRGSLHRPGLTAIPPLRGSIFVCHPPPAKTELSSHTRSKAPRNEKNKGFANGAPFGKLRAGSEGAPLQSSYLERGASQPLMCGQVCLLAPLPAIIPMCPPATRKSSLSLLLTFAMMGSD